MSPAEQMDQIGLTTDVFAEVVIQGLMDGGPRPMDYFSLVEPELLAAARAAAERAREHYGEPEAGLHPITCLEEAWFTFAVSCFHRGINAGAVTERYRVQFGEALTT